MLGHEHQHNTSEKPDHDLQKFSNEQQIESTKVTIPLVKGKSTYIEKEAYVSKEDEDLAIKHTWKISQSGYAIHQQREGKKRYTSFLHREVAQRILGRPLTYDDIVEYKDENKLNNTRNNITISTRSEHTKRTNTRRGSLQQHLRRMRQS